MTMKSFLTKFGIKVKNDKPTNNKIINAFLCVLEIIYFMVSTYNLYYAKTVSGFAIALNCLSFSGVILLNYRTEREHLEKDTRFSLYFTMFLCESIFAFVILLAIILFGIEIEQLKTLLFMMVTTTVLNKIINIIINLYAEE